MSGKYWQSIGDVRQNPRKATSRMSCPLGKKGPPQQREEENIDFTERRNTLTSSAKLSFIVERTNVSDDDQPQKKWERALMAGLKCPSPMEVRTNQER